MSEGSDGRQRPEGIVHGAAARSADYFTRNYPTQCGFRGSAYRLQPEHAQLNLLPAARDAVPCFAASPPIQWHQHANHGLSSQACCVNFLMPFNNHLELLHKWIETVTSTKVDQLLPVDHRDELDYYVAFEWIGGVDYLNEANSKGDRKRGANATAADAAVKFRSNFGTELLLIEWKYTEQYKSHRLSEDRRQTRVKRYRDLAFAPNGPVRSNVGLELTDFFYEPFYQMLRQQMLAWHVQQDAESGIDRARVLHLSPSGNRDLHEVTSPHMKRFGNDAFDVFKSFLIRPDDFIAMPIEQAFSSLNQLNAPWLPGLAERYPTLVSA